MKISYRILLINFAIVVLILSSSALAFYSIMFEVLTSQQSKYLLNSANNLVYTLREVQQEWFDDLHYLKEKGEIAGSYTDQSRFNPQNIDFIFVESGNSGRLNPLLFNSHIVNGSTSGFFSLSDFLIENPLSLISTYKDSSGTTFYFGKIVSEEFLNLVSKRINSEVVLISKGIPVEISNQLNNQKYLDPLITVCKELNEKENYNVYTAAGSSGDIIATNYKTASGFGNDLQFLVFNSINEASGLRTSIQKFIIIIGSAGVILSLILTFLFTDKFRKQITLLSKATKISKEGKFLNKINLKSKDELGQLAGSFNEMIDELERSQKAKNDYSEFLTLLNQNPTLSEISDAALKKIIKSCGFTAGALYSVYKEEISLTSSFGTRSGISLKENNDLFYTVTKSKEPFELKFESGSPVITSGLYDISIKYLLIQPIIYNNKVIAILELAGVEPTGPEAKDYLENIQDQLAIGLTNAGAFVQLENLVSELKLLNDEYQKQNMQIRKQNDTLTELHAKLKEKADELEVQKEKAEESTKLKSQFLAGVSHELRTPMNSILGLTELILNDRELEKKSRERLEIVLKNSNRLMNLINDVLDLSKIEAGKMDVFIEEIVLEEIISIAESTVSALAVQKNLNFIINREIDTNITVQSDKEKIIQVIINLLDNAVKFTESGSVVFNISGEGDKLKFSVADTGIGISEKNLEFIFDEFRQVDGSNTRKYNGTGLGLAICKRIADILNGYISVESAPGKGSVFTFIVPKVLPGELHRNEELSNNRRPMLVIDHEAEMRYTIGQYLVSRNYEVVFVENSGDVMEIAGKINPAAITLNTSLPGHNSWDLLSSLKSEPSVKDIPVILLSTLGEENLGYAFNTFDYIIKPYTEEKLKAVFSNLESATGINANRIMFIDKEFQEAAEIIRSSALIEIVNEPKNIMHKISEFRPDLIIADLLMPEIDGLSLLQILRSNRDTRYLPVVISMPEKFTSEEKERLTSAVKDVTLKSKGHPLDMLKVIRDRTDVHEFAFRKNNMTSLSSEYEELDFEFIKNDEYIGEVLIVDDDADTLFTINEIVKTCNCKTILAKSGRECLEILEQQTPDLILLDIMMPELDGFQTLKKIKRKKNTEQIPVFAVTARAMAEDKEIILKYGFDDYISKPVNSGVIAFKIEKLFSKFKMA